MRIVIKNKKETKWDWHVWFAWYPVAIASYADNTTYVWLERIERKLIHENFETFDDYIYRPINDENT
jgi:hypothetical protein